MRESNSWSSLFLVGWCDATAGWRPQGELGFDHGRWGPRVRLAWNGPPTTPPTKGLQDPLSQTALPSHYLMIFLLSLANSESEANSNNNLMLAWKGLILAGLGLGLGGLWQTDAKHPKAPTTLPRASKLDPLPI